MPEHHAPGLFIEEMSSGAKPIEGVPTSVAGIVGPTHQGPIRGTPEVVTSLGEYTRVFGGAGDLSFGAEAVPCHTAHAARAFFDNGGKQLYVVRVVGGGTASTLAGGAPGNDGIAPSAVDYAGARDEVSGSTGLCALEDVDNVSIVMVPAAAEGDAETHLAITRAMQSHCAKMRHRVGIVDPREGTSLSDVQAFRDHFDDSRLALYYPWVVVADPAGVERALPPSGFVAGIYARVDAMRGVHKAPANAVVHGARRFETKITRAQQEVLNPKGVNCLRSFPGRGHRVWGARTMSSDADWKYVNVRRYSLYLERSIERGTQWVVFEPNGEALWAQMREAVSRFLHDEWKNGRLVGSKPESAYFVRCDRTTMTQDDIDNGRLVCTVGVAVVRPAEFVIFRVGQWTADANA